MRVPVALLPDHADPGGAGVQQDHAGAGEGLAVVGEGHFCDFDGHGSRDRRKVYRQKDKNFLKLHEEKADVSAFDLNRVEPTW